MAFEGVAMRPPTFIRVRFVAGMHNIGYYVAAIAFLGSSAMAISHLLAEGDAVIVDVRVECELPLNNRCRDILTMRSADGSTREGRFGIRGDPDDFVVGNHIEKKRWQLGYRVNGQPREWTFTRPLFGAWTLAVVAAWVARRLTPKSAGSH
jgi:hypothetical protein